MRIIIDVGNIVEQLKDSIETEIRAHEEVYERFGAEMSDEVKGYMGSHRAILKELNYLINNTQIKIVDDTEWGRAKLRRNQKENEHETN